MRDIREDLLQRRFGIVSRYFEAIARYEEQLQKLYECHRKLVTDLNTEKTAVDAMLAIENSRPTGDLKENSRPTSDLKEADTPATTALLRNLSEIVQRYPWEKTDNKENVGVKRDRESALMQNPPDRGEDS